VRPTPCPDAPCAAFVRDWAKKRGISLYSLAAQCCIPQTRLGRYAEGTYIPRADHLARIIAVLRVPRSDVARLLVEIGGAP
jgi:transcriptional regulator with XRE-family HTH domain